MDESTSYNPRFFGVAVTGVTVVVVVVVVVFEFVFVDSFLQDAITSANNETQINNRLFAGYPFLISFNVLIYNL